jgi:CHAT domain-containing protein
VADERFPLNSYIEFYRNAGANEPVQKAKVYARELLQLNFADTRLVVLNACETANGKIAAGEGVLNLVRIFMLRQVPAVIASLWQNDDRVSAHIAGELFKGVANSMDLPLALHQAKLQAIQKLQRDYQFPLPYFGAVFEVFQNNWDIKPAIKLNQPIGEKHATSSR